MNEACRPALKPMFRLWKYRQGVAAFIANRTRIPFGQCLEIVEVNWQILVGAYDEGARFQEAGRRILIAMDVPVPRLGTEFILRTHQPS